MNSMKNIVLLGCLLLASLLTGCFKDEGNYTYKDLGLAPKWIIDPNTEPIRINGTQGEMMKFMPQGKDFTFGEDSVAALDIFRYEWEVNGTIISEESNFEMKTDTVMARANLNKAKTGVTGILRIINKQNGITYIGRAYLGFRPKFYIGSFVVVSDKNTDATKCSYFRLKTRYDGPNLVYEYFMEDDLYYQMNGEDIPGKPLKIRNCLAPHISSTSGASLITTTEGVYQLNNETFTMYTDMKDEFLNGTPDNFKPADAFDNLRLSCIATQDGRIFKRQMSENYLTGKYLSDPYFIDSKGYKVTKFSTYVSRDREPLCFDEKNRRVLIIQSENNGMNATIRPLVKGDGNYYPFPLWEIPADVDVIHLCPTYDRKTYVSGNAIYYNQGGKTYKYDFRFSSSDMKVLENTESAPVALPVYLTSEDILMTFGCYSGPANKMVYAKGNEIHCINFGENYSDKLWISVDSKVTVLLYTVVYNSYKYMVVGCENGDVMVYAVDNELLTYRLVSKANVGGRVAGINETGFYYGADTF